MRYIIFSLILVSGCSLAVAPLETTKVMPFPKSKPYVGKTISVGLIVDNRFPFWPRKESQVPQDKNTKGGVVKNFEPLPATKEVRLPMGEVRSNLAHALKKSKRFEEIINPPQKIIGETITEMLKNSLETSDYLIVGEINVFNTKLIGLNSRANYTYPVDVFVLSFPNLICFLISGGRFFILSGGMFAVHTAECVLSLSLTVLFRRYRTANHHHSHQRKSSLSS